jgi:WD40 repeat protein/serine/threonine protein kinase
MSESDSKSAMVLELAEEFLERYRRGERPSLKEYTNRHPDLAAEIRDVFPAMALMENIALRDESLAGPTGTELTSGAPRLEQLGDYRIIREVGRGGMGIVYEAEQLSLGRHVALKVLPSHALLDPRQLQRFQREAKAVARLHHTNIVPVYGVGEHEGLHYYVMQFIQGLGLDLVLQELRRLRQPRGIPAPTQGDAPDRPTDVTRDVSAADVARALLTGEYRLAEPDSTLTTAPGEPAAAAERGASTPVRAADTSATVRLPGQAEGSTLSDSGSQYWQSVARVGVQVADALAHAASQGVLHRDIKPSNLLLDDTGNVWVTDFGLAKAASDGDNLTHTGDVIGTLRYLAPERFDGQGDLRSDVYSLGLTLYELLTLRLAFDETDRNQLVKQVMHDEPVQPRKLNPAVPRDLETVVLKAIACDPAHRYQTPAEMAEDLKHFVEDRPVKARRVSEAEKLWRWCRRNKGLAASLSAVALLTVVAAIGSSLAAFHFQQLAAENHTLADDKEAERVLAVQAKKVADQRAEDLAWEDYVNRIDRAYREVQDDNVALAEDLLHGCPSERRGWEWHYVKRLGHPERLSLEVPAGSVSAIAFSPDGRVIATGSGGYFFQGKGGSNVELWDRETGQRRPTLQRTANVIWGLAFSPDGAKLALGGTNPQVEVRDVRTGAVCWSNHEPNLPQAMSIAFSPDGRTLAAGFGKYSQQEAFQVKIYHAETGREAVAFPGPNGGVNHLAFHPDGRRLAVAGSQVVEVWDVGAPKRVHELPGHTKWIYGVAYSPDGKWLATGGWDRTIKLRDATSGEEKLTIFAHNGFVLDLAFSPDSRALVSTSEDRSVRLWEVPSGRLIGVLHGHADFVQAVAFAPDGRELASGGLEGTLKVWNRRSSFPVVFAGHTGLVGRVWYRRDGRRVLTAPLAHAVAGETTKGWDPSTGKVDPALTGIDSGKLGDGYLPPTVFPPDWSPPPAVTSPDGQLIVRIPPGDRGGRPAADRSKDYASNSIEVLDAKSGLVLHTLIGHTADVVGFAFSPDSRRLATASFDRTIKLWDTATGREVCTLRGHTAGVLVVAFSPDGHRLVSGGIDSTARVWDATPLPTGILQAQDARYQRKRKALAEQARAAEDAQRADNLAKSGQWDLAAAAFGKFIEQAPDHFEPRCRQIRALLEANDVAGAQRVCENLLKLANLTAANPNNHALAHMGAWACMLTPDAVADQGALVRLAEVLLNEVPEPGRYRSEQLRTLGAALYRAGRFAEATRSLEESNKNRGDDGDPRGFAFLAMAHHRLGQRAEATRWLDKLAAHRPKGAPICSGTTWRSASCVARPKR